MIEYKQQDGKPCSLYRLCRAEPDWAVSRITHIPVECAKLVCEPCAAGLPIDEGGRHVGCLYACRAIEIRRRFDLPYLLPPVGNEKRKDKTA